MSQAIRSAVQNALRLSLNLPGEQTIAMNANLKHDLGMDSMTSLTFMMALEETIGEFTVNPATLEIYDLETVQTITDYVVKTVNRQAIGSEDAVDNLVSESARHA